MPLQLFGANNNGGCRNGDANNNGGCRNGDANNGQFFSVLGRLPGDIHHANQISSLMSADQLIATASPINVINQNENVILGNNGFGQQIGFNYRKTEVSTTSVSHNKIRVRSMVEYEPLLRNFPTSQSPSPFPIIDFSGSASIINPELAKLQLLTALSTMEGSSLFNNGVPRFHQRKSNNKLVASFFGNGNYEYKGNGVIAGPPVRSVRFLGSEPERDRVNSRQTQQDEFRARRNSNFKKRGPPYLCNRCSKLFVIPQAYAAHMGSHYKAESRAERMRRRAMKYRKKEKLVRVQTSNGLTVVPETFQMTEDMVVDNSSMNGGRKERICGGEFANGKEIVKEEEGAVVMHLGMENSLAIVAVKEEPM